MDKQEQNREAQDQKTEVHNRPGSNEHNDYRIKGNEGKEHRDEKDAYTDYNGNSEANNPARANEGS